MRIEVKRRGAEEGEHRMREVKCIDMNRNMHRSQNSSTCTSYLHHVVNTCTHDVLGIR